MRYVQKLLTTLRSPVKWFLFIYFFFLITGTYLPQTIHNTYVTLDFKTLSSLGHIWNCNLNVFSKLTLNGLSFCVSVKETQQKKVTMFHWLLVKYIVLKQLNKHVYVLSRNKFNNKLRFTACIFYNTQASRAYTPLLRNYLSPEISAKKTFLAARRCSCMKC